MRTLKIEDVTDIKGMADIFTKPVSKGIASITPYEFKESNDPIYNLRAIRDGGLLFKMYDGKYCRLVVDGKLMMSDTNMERRSNNYFINRANGKVLIVGLGLGLIIRNIIDKSEVKEIIVIEKYQDVVDLVEPKFHNNPKLKIICADIFTWKPAKGEKFDTIYFDIWPDINTDNLNQIRVLHNKFKFNLNRSNGEAWMNSWMKEFLQQQKKQEARYYKSF